ncbi:MAG: hypothetical protein ABIJ47_16195 [Candidatus Bathyarchaeota archaeon]
MDQVSVEWLRGLGMGYGFDVGAYMGADLAWFLRDGEPVFSFALDSGDGSGGFMVTLGLFWGSADYINKPWCHFLVLVGGALNPEHRAMLGALAFQFQVRVVDDPKPGDFRALLDERVAYLVKTLGRYAPDGSVASLKRSVGAWMGERPRVEVRYRCSAAYDPGSLAVFGEGGELGPSRRAVPVSLVAGWARLEGVLLRLVEAGGLRFSTEHRSLPLVVELGLGGDPWLGLRFEAEKGNLAQAVAFEEFLVAAGESVVRVVDAGGSSLVELQLL